MGGKKKDIVSGIIAVHTEMQKMLDDIFTVGEQGEVFRPPTDVYITDKEVVVRVEVAGIAKEDVEATFDNGRLIIRGYRSDPSGEPKLAYLQMEIGRGAFERVVPVRVSVDTNGITAVMESGFLVIRLPLVRDVTRNVPIT